MPGPKKSLVIIKSAIKNEGKIKETLELVSFEEPKANIEVSEEVNETKTEEVKEVTTDETIAEEVTEESSQE